MLYDIWMAETKAEAEKALDLFIATFEAKYPKATACLAKDRDVLLTFYDFPAEHWVHIRTTNPIESIPARRDNGSPADTENEGLWFANRLPDDGVPIGSVCRAALASPQRLDAAG